MGRVNCTKDAIKKSNELKVLELALNQGVISEQDDTRIICTSLNESTITSMERPDFILTNSQEGICYGVELLRVDHQIKKQHGTIGAASTQFYHQAEKVRQKYKDNIDGNEVNALNELNDAVEAQLNRTFNATYDDLIKSFQHSLKKHYGKDDIYKSNCVEQMPEDYSYRSVLLIEVVTDFARLYKCSYRKAEKNTGGLMPLFDDVINLLSGEELKNVDYFVLFLKNYLRNETQIIALNNNDLKKSLERNRIKPVKYCSFEKYLVDENRKAVDLILDEAYKDNDEIKSPYYVDYRLCKDERFMPAVQTAAKEAMYCKANHEDFVTDYCVLLFIEVYGDNVKNWIRVEGTDLYIANIEIDPVVQKRRLRKFDDRYPNPKTAKKIGRTYGKILW